MQPFHSLTASKFDEALFAQPSVEYRGMPFWSWNTRLDREQLFRQIGYLQKMGFGGFHIHPRTGLDTEYLGEEFMELVRGCVEEGQRLGLLAWLYDEDRWPSGFAGGKVTVDAQYRAKYLVFTPTSNEEFGQGEPINNSGAFGSRLGTGTLLARYEVLLADGLLDYYRLLAEEELPAHGGTVWYAYLETASPVPWFNNQTYVDTLSRSAIDRFVEVTHDVYRREVGSFFGNTIPAIFTDEPQFVRKGTFTGPEDRCDLIIPFTEDLLRTYEQAFGQRLEEHLPEIFWELPQGVPSIVRYRYHDHVCERFNEAFVDNISRWCDQNHLLLTGHMMEEQGLETQTHSLGEAMRSYRSFHIPGIDVLGFDPQYTTAKQAQSAAHQYGRPAVMSELYGITGWDTSFADYKAQGDWQAALGVTLRVPHLSLVSLAGEAKRDYPASLNHHVPWFEEFALIEDHFARIATTMTRGKPLVRIGVIHPIESFWLCYGPTTQTSSERLDRENNFRNITEWLLFGLTDFDFICEATLPTLHREDENGALFGVGKMEYDVVIAPAMRTIRQSTLARLEAFADRGGIILFAGEVPTLVDAVLDARPTDLSKRCVRVPYSQTALCIALKPFTEITILRMDGTFASKIIHQYRFNEDERYLFFCNTDRLSSSGVVEISIAGAWEIKALDTLTGLSRSVPVEYRSGITYVTHEFSAYGHLLLWLQPSVVMASSYALPPRELWEQTGRVHGPVSVSLSEPNVLLLDQAEYRINGGEWHASEELLRLENYARLQCGLPPKSGNITQPWADQSPHEVLGTLELRFRIESDIDIDTAVLALEKSGNISVFWNDAIVPTSEPCGYYIDEAIEKVRLPFIQAGSHRLTVKMEISSRMNVEWCYLLGDFGVRVEGHAARIVSPVRSLHWGDWTTQGLPFYGGNVTYHARFQGSGKRARLGFSQFRAPLLSVRMDNEEPVKVAFAPYRADLGRVGYGEHILDILAYGSRVNTLGPLHSMKPICRGMGPWSWRSEGDDWSYEYQISPCGILTAPSVEELSLIAE